MSLLFAVLFSSWITGAIIFLVLSNNDPKIHPAVSSIVCAIIWPVVIVGLIIGSLKNLFV